MISSFKNSFFVFGNPIHHTKSPYIHSLFSKQTGILYRYEAKLVPIDQFKDYISNFFLKNGKGANITIPFKEQAYLISNYLTNRAKISKSVNTFKKLKNNKILGDNTDGMGILYDLKRIGYIKKNSERILLIGAGGAARGIIFSLLQNGCKVTIINRTVKKAEIIINDFKNYHASISVFDSSLLNNYSFNVIINASSNVNQNSNLNIIKFFINKNIYCYDINYCQQNKYTPFLVWCMKNGAVKVSNGIGMLVSQAAYSFYLWYNFFPKISPIINILTSSYV